MNKITLFFLCLGLFLVSGGVVIGLRIGQVKSGQQSAFVPQPLTHSLTPPTKSLVGKVTVVTGEAEKQPRDQVQPVKITPDLIVQEAEQITTQAKSTVLITFPTSLTVALEPNTGLAFASTDPTHFLVNQNQGSVAYQTDPATQSISVRTLHGLFTLTQGKADLTTDPFKHTVIFTISQGSGLIGYINKENQTQMATVSAGQTATFDDTKRLVEIK